MARRSRIRKYQQPLPGLQPVPAVGKAIVIRISDPQPDPAVQLPLVDHHEWLRQQALAHARAYADLALEILENQMSEIEEAADNLEAQFPASERVYVLREAADAISGLVDALTSIEWPTDPAAKPPAVQVAQPPLVTRGPRKGLPKTVKPAELRQIGLIAAADYLTAAANALADFTGDRHVAELLQELSRIEPSEIELSEE